MHGNAETAQLHWGGIFLASQEGALRLQVTMNNVILVAVTQRFEDLSHVVTVKENAVFLGAGAYTTRHPCCTRHESTPSVENNSEGHTGYRHLCAT